MKVGKKRLTRMEKLCLISIGFDVLFLTVVSVVECKMSFVVCGSRSLGVTPLWLFLWAFPELIFYG